VSIPRLFLHLVDDAAIFPPGLAPLPDAVSAHVAHLSSAHAELVGPFIVDERRLDELGVLAPDGLAVSVVVPAPEDVASVVKRAGAAGLGLAGLEVKLDPTRGPAAQIAEIALAAPPGVPTYVEVPRPGNESWPAAVSAVADHGLRLKFRTGGTEAAAFPTEGEVAAWITAATAARIPFKCTAGLHNAVRHTAHETGFEHHGYLNVLLATARAIADGEASAVVAALALRDPSGLVAALEDLPDETLAQARDAFTSYGSCSILEPLEDLTALHLLSH
jgi:hypothetical protein